MGKIKIKNRERGLTTGYDMRIYLDNNLICLLLSGGEFELDVPPGPHKLRVKESVFGSKDYSFTIFNKEDRVFIVTKSNTGNIFLISSYILLALLGGIFFSNSFKAELFPGVFAISGLILVVFYLFVFRNDAFVIREEGKY